MAYFAIPLTVLALSFVIHGFPNIDIGNTYNYYNEPEEDEKDED